MKAFKYLVFISLYIFSTNSYSLTKTEYAISGSASWFDTPELACRNWVSQQPTNANQTWSYVSSTETLCNAHFFDFGTQKNRSAPIQNRVTNYEPQCEAGIVPITLKVPVSSGKMVCVNSCQYSLTKCVDVDFEAGMTCDGVNEGRECGTSPPTTTPTTPPVTQDPTNPTDKTDEQKTFENIMHVIGEKLDGIKDAITGGNQNQNGGDTGGSNGGDTGGDVNVNVDMSETNAKIDETNSLIDELTKWLQGEDLGDDIFGDQEPPEKELTPQQLETNIFSGRAQCPADSRLSFNLLGGKTFTKTFEFKDWCDNLEIFGSLILIASYLFGAYIIVSKS